MEGDTKFVSVEVSGTQAKCAELATAGKVVQSVTQPYDVYTSEGTVRHVTIAYLETLTEQGGEPCLRDLPAR